jgi:hypothetical protein
MKVISLVDGNRGSLHRFTPAYLTKTSGNETHASLLIEATGQKNLKMPLNWWSILTHCQWKSFSDYQ